MAMKIGNILLESSVSYGFGLRGPDGWRTGDVFFSTCMSSSSSFSSGAKEGSSGISMYKKFQYAGIFLNEKHFFMFL